MIINHLQELSLKGMIEAYELQDLSSSYSQMSFNERLDLLLVAEKTFKANAKIKRLLKGAKLRYSNASMELIDFKAARELDKTLINELSTLNWVQNNQNIIITGATGTGKSWLACALVDHACRLGHSALYITAQNLFENINQAVADGSIRKLINQLTRFKILVIDDWCLGGIDNRFCPYLLEIIDKRSMNGSLVLTTQYPIPQWFESFEDETIADAIIDRIIHNSHDISLKGPSMRRGKVKSK
ncbi:MAG: IS21-like element helper ATPase IstB [Colwellia sp.]|nr:IS21-like element helper ATPase IstB [Colwellia sp.]